HAHLCLRPPGPQSTRTARPVRHRYPRGPGRRIGTPRRPGTAGRDGPADRAVGGPVGGHGRRTTRRTGNGYRTPARPRRVPRARGLLVQEGVAHGPRTTAPPSAAAVPRNHGQQPFRHHRRRAQRPPARPRTHRPRRLSHRRPTGHRRRSNGCRRSPRRGRPRTAHTAGGETRSGTRHQPLEFQTGPRRPALPGERTGRYRLRERGGTRDPAAPPRPPPGAAVTATRTAATRYRPVLPRTDPHRFPGRRSVTHRRAHIRFAATALAPGDPGRSTTAGPDRAPRRATRRTAGLGRATGRRRRAVGRAGPARRCPRRDRPPPPRG